MQTPPRFVRALQNAGFLLSHPQHAEHHAPPYVSNYCIALGWCNAGLVCTQFFPRLEHMITKLTGATPREDEMHMVDVRASQGSHITDVVSVAA